MCDGSISQIPLTQLVPLAPHRAHRENHAGGAGAAGAAQRADLASLAIARDLLKTPLLFIQQDEADVDAASDLPPGLLVLKASVSSEVAHRGLKRRHLLMQHIL